MDTSPARPADLPLSSMGERGVKEEGVQMWPSSCCGPKTRQTVLALWVSVYRHTSHSEACTLELTAHPHQPAADRPLWLLHDVIRVAWLLRRRQQAAGSTKQPKGKHLSVSQTYGTKLCTRSTKKTKFSFLSLSMGRPKHITGPSEKGGGAFPTPSPEYGGVCPGAVIMRTSHIPAALQLRSADTHFTIIEVPTGMSFDNSSAGWSLPRAIVLIMSSLAIMLTEDEGSRGGNESEGESSVQVSIERAELLFQNTDGLH